MDFSLFFTSLSSGKIDLAIGGMTISNYPGYIFSLPYKVSRGRFLITSSSKVASVSDLTGKKVGILLGEALSDAFYLYLVNNYNEQFQIKKYDDMEDIITALSQGKIAASFLHVSTAAYWEQNGGGQFKGLGPPIMLGNGIGILSTSAGAPLIQHINQQIQAIEKDNSYLILYNRYFAGDGE